MAMLFDRDRTWVLMIRCLDHETTIVVRRQDEPEQTQPLIRYFAGTLGIDGQTVPLPVQTFSQGGFLILNAAASVDRIEKGQRIAFDFDEGGKRTQAMFLISHTKEALAPVRRMCAAAAS